MLNVPATISFFSIAGFIVAGVAIMAWRTRRKSKMQAIFRAKSRAKAEPEADDDDESYHIDVEHDSRQYEDNAGDSGPMLNRQVRRWRWKRILYRVGWIRMSSDFERDDDGHDHDLEMRDKGRRGAVVGGEAAGFGNVAASVQWSTRSEPGPETKTVAAGGGDAVNELCVPRPTDVPSFENLGGYRYGDLVYGPDNMSPLPVPGLPPVPVPVSGPGSISHYNQCHEHYHQHSFSQAIAEVEGMSEVSGISKPAGKRNCNDLLPLRHAYSLTSYNGFPSSSQDDVMAALPIPKDHPLSQHHPIDRQHAVLSVLGARMLFNRGEEVNRKEQKLDEEDRIRHTEGLVVQEESNESNLQEGSGRESNVQESNVQESNESNVQESNVQESNVQEQQRPGEQRPGEQR
ncbi:hypothetical protein A1O7_10052 [Cladophialophora yegresii CBS 114405]|uniref:Uncharacterized protein n=1 Tax=Cladophialophora yegresii CBS 114405 TaxID=1182544 RepID=W9VRC2_9EURO|nr:uncharacterized protein A1O7_10052 [Cladophialophora yegresii CBS 114405]EXJ54711.1 hypothetical protein A1O7_10052 [Cladophialophora yegresii CBS 114405]